MEKRPTSLVIKDMQIKIMCVCFPDELAKIKKRMLIPNEYCYSFQGCGEIGALYPADGTPFLEGNLAVWIPS